MDFVDDCCSSRREMFGCFVGKSSLFSNHDVKNMDDCEMSEKEQNMEKLLKHCDSGKFSRIYDFYDNCDEFFHLRAIGAKTPAT